MAEHRRLRQQRQELLDRQIIGAVREGSTAGVASFLAAGASVSGSPNLGAPPILHAAGMGNVSMIRFLVNNGAHVNVGTSKRTEGTAQGCRALHAAARGGHGVACRTLLEAGADPNATDEEGHTSLMAICNADTVRAARRVVALRELLEAGGDASLADVDGRTAMHFAVSHEDGDCLIDLLWSHSPSTLTKPDLEGMTPLALAAQRGRPRSIEHLLSLGATQPFETCEMPLVEAVAGNHVSSMDALLSAGLEVVGGPDSLVAAIFGALANGPCRALQHLLDVEVEEAEQRWDNARCVGGGSMLHFASSLGNAAALGVLLAAGADETAVDRAGRSAIDVVEENVEEFGRSRDLPKAAACRLALERAAAHRAVSWSFPTGASLVGDGKAARRQQEGGLRVRIFRPTNRTFLVRHVGRREGSAGVASGL